MKIGSLFSGYGGLDLAAETHFNAETVWHAEWENAPSKVLAHHWPGVPQQALAALEHMTPLVEGQHANANA